MERTATRLPSEAMTDSIFATLRYVTWFSWIVCYVTYGDGSSDVAFPRLVFSIFSVALVMKMGMSSL